MLVTTKCQRRKFQRAFSMCSPRLRCLQPGRSQMAHGEVNPPWYHLGAGMAKLHGMLLVGAFPKGPKGVGSFTLRYHRTQDAA